MASERQQRWERRVETPLVGAALLFLVAYAVPILWPDLPGPARLVGEVVVLLVWAAFAVDLVVRLWLTDSRSAFLRAHWPDVVTVLLPALRPLRAVVALSVIGRRGRVFRSRVVASVAATVGVVGVVASLAVLDAERGAQSATISTFGDALWWALATVTTVGYGDLTPTTQEGRLVAGVLMASGIALLGVVSAAIASWFVEKVAEAAATRDRSAEHLVELLEEVRALRAEVARLRDHPPPGG